MRISRHTLFARVRRERLNLAIALVWSIACLAALVYVAAFGSVRSGP